MNLAEVLSAAEVHALLEAPTAMTDVEVAAAPAVTADSGHRSGPIGQGTARGPQVKPLTLPKATPWTGLHTLHVEAARVVTTELRQRAAAAIVVSVTPYEAESTNTVSLAEQGAAPGAPECEPALDTWQRPLDGLSGLPSDQPVVIAGQTHFGNRLFDVLLGGSGTFEPVASPATVAFREFLLRTFEGALRTAWDGAQANAQTADDGPRSLIPFRFRRGATVRVIFALHACTEVLEVQWPATALDRSTRLLWSGGGRPRHDTPPRSSGHTTGSMADIPLELNAALELGELNVAALTALKPGQLLPAAPELTLRCRETSCVRARFASAGPGRRHPRQLVVTDRRGA